MNQTFKTAVLGVGSAVGVMVMGSIAHDVMNNSTTNNTPSQPRPSLNPNATPFESTNSPHVSPSVSPLSPIAEEKSEFTFEHIEQMQSESEWILQPLHPSQPILTGRQIVYIAQDITKTAIRKNAMTEYFASDKELFYHLRWTPRMQVIDGLYKIFKSRVTNAELVIFNVDIRGNKGGQLYIVCTQNDSAKQHIVKWKMVAFMTADMIFERYRISDGYLPQGSRHNLSKQVQRMQFGSDIKHNYVIDIDEIVRVEQIKKKPSMNQLTVTVSELQKCIRDSIAKYELMPIIWFDKKAQNSNYRIQMLLPVQLRGNNWIGIVYDYNEKQRLIPVCVCVDHIDIQRKLALYKPLTSAGEHKWFVNRISEIKVTKDEIARMIWERDESIKALNARNGALERLLRQQMSENQAKDDLIARKDREIQMLRRWNVNV